VYYFREGASATGFARVVFVTGRGRGGYVSGNPRPAHVRGPPALIPWTGPRLLPPIFNGDPSGVWVGRGPQRGQGQGMRKKAPRPRPLSGAGWGKGPGARVFLGPVRPVTNSKQERYQWEQQVPWGPADSNSPKGPVCFDKQEG